MVVDSSIAVGIVVVMENDDDVVIVIDDDDDDNNVYYVYYPMYGVAISIVLISSIMMDMVVCFRKSCCITVFVGLTLSFFQPLSLGINTPLPSLLLPPPTPLSPLRPLPSSA